MIIGVVHRMQKGVLLILFLGASLATGKQMISALTCKCAMPSEIVFDCAYIHALIRALSTMFSANAIRK